MKKYKIFLLDADQTLFDFVKAEDASLQKAFEAKRLPFNEDVRLTYREINEGLWRDLEKGKLTKEELQRTRFVKLFDVLSIPEDGIAFNDLYLDELAQSPCLLPGALTVCRTLAKEAVLYIVTNGITRVRSGGSLFRRLPPISPTFSFRRKPAPPNPTNATSTMYLRKPPSPAPKTCCWWATPSQATWPALKPAESTAAGSILTDWKAPLLLRPTPSPLFWNCWPSSEKKPGKKTPPSFCQ